MGGVLKKGRGGIYISVPTESLANVAEDGLCGASGTSPFTERSAKHVL